MAEQNTVKVKLAARSLVLGEIKEAGAIVELPELADDGRPFAVCFGEIVKAEAPAKSDEKTK
jgi:hypothetical protein